MSAAPYRPKCAWDVTCVKPVTHIGNKGFIYCTRHAEIRRTLGSERTRALKVWELEHIRNDRPLVSYKPISQAEDYTIRAQRRAAARK